MEQFLNVTQKLFQGFGENCIIFAVTLLAAIPLGLLVSFGSRSRFAPLRLLVKTVVWIIRGTPLMLQLFVVFYVTPLLFGGIKFDRMNAALLDYESAMGIEGGNGANTVPFVIEMHQIIEDAAKAGARIEEVTE